MSEQHHETPAEGAGLGLKLARLLVAAGLVLVVFFGILSIELPYLVIEPGPTRNVAELIEIDGPIHPSRGSFIMVTALIRATGGVTVPAALGAFFDPDRDLVTRESVFPTGATRTQTDRVHDAQMSESQQEGAVAALAELGMTSRPDGAFVREASGNSPAARILRPGDVITGVGKTPIVRLSDLTDVVGDRKPGERVHLTLRREGRLKDVDVRTVEDPESGKTRIGVVVIQNRKLPVEIRATSGDVGGPSAGLVFALSVYDALTPGDLTGGKTIAGTGTIANAGKRTGIVGAVGAVSQKITGAQQGRAEIFVVPAEEAGEAREAAGPKMQVIAVSTLNEAIKKLEKLQQD